MYIHYQLQFDNYCRALTQATTDLTVNIQQKHFV